MQSPTGNKLQHFEAKNTVKNKCRVREGKVKGKYPPRSHEDMPCETEFANSVEDAQLDVERREKNFNKCWTMVMWCNVIEHTWESHPVSDIHKPIDRQPKIQQAIVDARGGRVNL